MGDSTTKRAGDKTEKDGVGDRIHGGRSLTDGDITLSTQRSAQDPVLPNRHDLARRILREIDFNISLQLRGMWSILPYHQKETQIDPSSIATQQQKKRTARRQNRVSLPAPRLTI